jgi:hypothetical protein
MHIFSLNFITKDRFSSALSSICPILLYINILESKIDIENIFISIVWSLSNNF